jgi:hypothetical protein
VKPVPRGRARARNSTNWKPGKESEMQPAKPVNPGAGPEQPKTGAPGEVGATSGNVDKIRDILFGSQMKDYETRFNRLEESLLNQTAELRESTKKRLDSLESYLKRELEALQSRLKTERDERSEAINHLSREIKDLGDALNRKLREGEDRSSESERSLREQILQQSKDLLEEIRTRQTELNGLLDRRIQDLSQAKADRTMLGALFTEVAMRLTDEFQIPGTEG